MLAAMCQSMDPLGCQNRTHALEFGRPFAKPRVINEPPGLPPARALWLRGLPDTAMVLRTRKPNLACCGLGRIYSTHRALFDQRLSSTLSLNASAAGAVPFNFVQGCHLSELYKSPSLFVHELGSSVLTKLARGSALRSRVGTDCLHSSPRFGG